MRILVLLLFTLSTLFACQSSKADQPRRPNIVLIVADDLGFSDVGFNGCKEIPTPNLDAIAASGIAFESGYASHPYCSPSRAGLLTGRYQQRFGHECNPEPGDVADDSNATGLPLSETTIANALKDAGYVTGAIGKWHLGDTREYWPNRRGFDEWFGFSGGGLSYWGDAGKKGAGMGVHRGDEPVALKDLTYLTDDFSEEAVAFIDRHKTEPFFLYLAYNAPHAPDQATREHLKKTEHIEYGGRAVYGAMVAGMDQGIGRVVDELTAENLLENTLIIFYSDNGGRREHATNFPYRGHKRMLFEGGIRVPFCVSWPETLPAGKRLIAPVSALDVFPTALAAAGIPPADDLKLDGINLLPQLQADEEKPSKRTLFWRYAASKTKFGYAVRDGDMKLVDSVYKGRKLLFDLSSDPWERQDLAADQPETVKRLSNLLFAWDANNIQPLWLDPHGPNIAAEESKRQKTIDAASRGERK